MYKHTYIRRCSAASVPIVHHRVQTIQHWTGNGITGKLLVIYLAQLVVRLQFVKISDTPRGFGVQFRDTGGWWRGRGREAWYQITILGQILRVSDLFNEQNTVQFCCTRWHQLVSTIPYAHTPTIIERDTTLNNTGYNLLQRIVPRVKWLHMMTLLPQPEIYVAEI